MPTRKTLRDLAIAALSDDETGVAAVAGRVYASRIAPLPGESNAGASPKLPALMVYADRIQREATAAGFQAVVVVLTVHVVCEGATESAVESSLDSISESVESILFSDFDFNEDLEGIMQTQVERAVSADSDRFTGQDVHQFALRWSELI